MLYYLLALPLFAPLIAQNVKPLPALLQKTWRMELSGQTQIIKLTGTEIEMKVTGARLPPQDYTEKLLIASYKV
jgi:hypothetical protein